MPFELYNPNRPVEPTLPMYSTNKLADPPPRLSQRDYTTLSRDEALDLTVGAFLDEKSRGAESWQYGALNDTLFRLMVGTGRRSYTSKTYGVTVKAELVVCTPKEGREATSVEWLIANGHEDAAKSHNYLKELALGGRLPRGLFNIEGRIRVLSSLEDPHSVESGAPLS